MIRVDWCALPGHVAGPGMWNLCWAWQDCHSCHAQSSSSPHARQLRLLWIVAKSACYQLKVEVVLHFDDFFGDADADQLQGKLSCKSSCVEEGQRRGSRSFSGSCRSCWSDICSSANLTLGSREALAVFFGVVEEVVDADEQRSSHWCTCLPRAGGSLVWYFKKWICRGLWSEGHSDRFMKRPRGWVWVRSGGLQSI